MKIKFTFIICVLCLLVLAGCSNMTVQKYIDLKEDSFQSQLEEEEIAAEMIDEDGVLVIEYKYVYESDFSDKQLEAYYKSVDSYFDADGEKILEEMESMGIPNPKLTIRVLTIEGMEVFSKSYE